MLSVMGDQQYLQLTLWNLAGFPTKDRQPRWWFGIPTKPSPVHNPPSRWFQHVSNMWFHFLLNNSERFNRGCHSVSELGDVVQWWTTRAGQRSITMGHQLNRRCCDTPPLLFGFHLVSSVYNYIHSTGRKTHLLSCDMYPHFCFHLFMYSFVCFLFILFVCFSNYSLIFHASG